MGRNSKKKWKWNNLIICTSPHCVLNTKVSQNSMLQFKRSCAYKNTGLTDWLMDWLTDRLTDGLTDRQTDWQTDGLTDWQTDWLMDVKNIIPLTTLLQWYKNKGDTSSPKTVKWEQSQVKFMVSHIFQIFLKI